MRVKWREAWEDRKGQSGHKLVDGKLLIPLLILWLKVLRHIPVTHQLCPEHVARCRVSWATPRSKVRETTLPNGPFPHEIAPIIFKGYLTRWSCRLLACPAFFTTTTTTTTTGLFVLSELDIFLTSCPCGLGPCNPV